MTTASASQLLDYTRQLALTPQGLDRVLAAADGSDATLDEALRSALDDGDGKAALLIAMALVELGRTPTAETVARLFHIAPQPFHVAPLVGRCGDDRVDSLLTVAESEAISWERVSLALLMAAILLKGKEPPARFIAALQQHARRPLDPTALAILGQAASEVDEPSVQASCASAISCARYVRMESVQERVHRLLLASCSQVLSELSAFTGIPEVTLRRSGPKVGRNDPCSCGSGKKYKKCCEGKGKEYQVVKTRAMELEEQLRPVALHSLEPRNLPDDAIWPAFRSLVLYRHWEKAAIALEEILRRGEGGDDPDGHWSDLLQDASRAGQVAFVRHHLEKVTDPNERRRLQLSIDLQEEQKVLDQIEEAARSGFLDDSENLYFLAFSLLDHRPALGILVARALLDPARAFDTETLLLNIEETRARLGLPPEDPFQTFYDRLQDWKPPAPVKDDDAETTRRELQRTRERVERLERQLKTTEERLRPKSPALPAAPPERPDPKSTPQASPAPDQVQGLRDKVERLKSLIAEGQEERKSLRRDLERLENAGRGSVAPPAPVVATAPDDDGAPFPQDTRYGVLGSHLGDASIEALRHCPPSVAREALEAITALSLGDAAAWSCVKQLKLVRLLSFRVGGSYRLLFRIVPHTHRLIVEHFIHRRDLEQTLRQHT